MFWKKKSGPEEVNEVRYACLAPNYLEIVNNEDAESLDEIKEQLFLKLEPNVYTMDEINKMSEMMEFDCWKAMVWCDARYRQKTTKSETSVLIYERLVEFLPTLSTEKSYEILDHLNYEAFYSRDDIGRVEKALGYDIYNICEWQSYRKINYKVPEENIDLTYYRKQ